MMNFSITVYIVAAVVAFLLASVVLHLILTPWLRRRKETIGQLKSSEVTATSTPLEKPLNTFKTRATNSVTYRFSIFKRVAWVLLLSIILLGVALPFMDQLPQALISILVGSGAVITGIAARPFIENFLSGILITSSKMLSIGDTILINDNYGTIEDISSTHTVIKLWDWRRFVIPNGTMINHEFINYSLYDNWQFAHVEFFVSHEEDMERVKELAVSVATKSNHFSDIEPPSFWVMGMGKDAIKCWVAAWADSPMAAWSLKTDMRTELILQFNKGGVKAHLNHHEFRSAEKSPF